MPLPVLGHGSAGSADSFRAADPSVIKDGSVWKLWYTGDDSNKKRIAYATSADGMTWAKGGKVIAPEDPGVSANIEYGAYAPTVWKTASGYSMLLTGRKLVGGAVFQTKVIDTTSTDGLVWAGPSPALNPSGTNSNFDFSNLNWSGRALGSRHVERLQALLRREHARRQRQLPHAHRARDLHQRHFVQQVQRLADGRLGARRRFRGNGVRRAAGLRCLGGGAGRR